MVFNEMFQFTCNAGLMKKNVQRTKYQTKHIPSIIIKEWRLPLWTLEGVCTGSLLRRTDLIKTLFVCVCLCYISPVTSCGVDPIRRVENYARSKGFDSASPVLNYMRLNTPSDYDTLMKEKKKFIDCTIMVHTGYFKRSQEAPVNTQQLLPVPVMAGTETFSKRSGNKLRQILMNGGSFQPGSYLDSDLEAPWGGRQQQLDQLGLQEALSLFGDDAFLTLVERLKESGQESSVLLPEEDQFGVPEFYKELGGR